MAESFWQILEEIAKRREIVIDRPKGSSHPRYPDTIYPLDYGYLKGTHSMDGEGLDVWRGSLCGRGLTGIVCTADRIKGDCEIKLLIDCTAEEMQAINLFHNSSENMKGMLIPREE